MLRILLSRWSYSLLGVALLGAVIWYLGPLVPGLEEWPPRAGILLLLVAIWVGANLFITLRHRARENALAAGVSGGSSAEAAGERAAIEAKITTALALLQKARGTRGYLYEQPWYAIIGPPGAGKTTALLNAGLEFPLAKEMGRGAVAGVGGTRLCEWWFTDKAVLIDTAGRYTTQDSDAAIDRAGWDTFLDLLKDTRPAQPLNGVIVAIALSDIASATPDERSAHARAIRARINELETKFGMRLPVYALFTKADLLAGFMEFFEDLDRDGRAQVWGTTFANGAPVAETVGEFAGAFHDLVDRVGHRLIDRLQAESSPERRALITGFPTQLASLEAPLDSFVTEAFGDHPIGVTPMLRGVYLTSATQEGTPIDRLTGSIARAFGLSPQQTARLRPQEGRTYFLTRLLRDVVFNEAMLVSGGRKRGGGWLAPTIAGVVALLIVGAAGGVLWRAYAGGQASIDAAAATLAGYAEAASALPLDPVQDSALTQLLPLLDRARTLPFAADPDSRPDSIWQALSQREKLGVAARALYRHGLDYALLPRLIWRLEAQLRGNLNNPDFLYEATRIYLMLTGQGPVDRDLVREWLMADWQATYPGADKLRESLSRHLDALLAEPLPTIVPDGELIAQARITFARVTLAQRVYSRIRPSAAAQRLPPWRPSDALGAAGALIFVRASGRPLDEGVPGFTTINGFHNVLLPALPGAVREAAAEGWVLGRKIELDPQSDQIRALERDVIALYVADYAKAWDEMIADLNLAPLRSLTQAAQDLYIVASEHSPLRALLASVARQLTLSEPPAAATPGQPAAGGDARLQALLGARPQTAARPGQEIDARYRALREAAGSGPGAPIDRTLRTIGDLQQQLAKLAASGTRTSAVPAAGEDPALALQTEAQRQPQPLARWLATAAASGIALRSGDARLQVSAAYNATGGPAATCAAAVAGRYPFVANAPAEISVEDFARVFAPGGVLDGFFNTLLRPYVDTKSSPWKAIVAEGATATIAANEVAQFQRAAQIRDLFFADGRSVPSIRFDLAPVSLGPKSTKVTLDLDGTIVAFSRDAPRATEITWPSAGPARTASLAFEPAGQPGWQESGTWAMFRLFGRGRTAAGANAERTALSFQQADRTAAFDLRTGARNPLAPGVLQAFRCPVIQ